MKKIIISSIMFLALCMCSDLFAQAKDSFFDYKSTSINDGGYEYEEMTSDVNIEANRAPIGAGLFILGALALGYASLKNN